MRDPRRLGRVPPATSSSNLGAAEEAGCSTPAAPSTACDHPQPGSSPPAAPTWTRVRAQLTDLFAGRGPADHARRCCAPSPGPRSRCRSRWPTTSTSTPPSTTPPTSAGSCDRTPRRCRRTGSTSRSGTTAGRAPWSSPAPRSSARPASARARGEPPTYGPSERLDIEAEVGFVVGVPTGLGEPVDIADFARARVRRGARQRLERARHPGLGVAAARPVPGQVVRDVGLAVGGAAGRARAGPGRPAGAGPAAAAVPARDRGWGLDISLEIEWNGTWWPARRTRQMYWTAGPAAGPPDRQRRQRCAPATCTPPARFPARRRPGRIVPRADLERRTDRSPSTTARRRLSARWRHGHDFGCRIVLRCPGRCRHGWLR